MTTYADNFTHRVRGSYIAMGIPHRWQVRAIGTGSFTDIQANTIAETLNNYVLSFEATLCSDWAWTGWEYAARNTDVFIPFTPSLTDTIVGIADFSATGKRKRISACNQAGRGATGSARMYWWGILTSDVQTTDKASDLVLTSAEITGLPGATGIINGALGTSSGAPATFYERLTYKENDRLVRLVRRGLI